MIFSGDPSKALWHQINRLSRSKQSYRSRRRLARRVHFALYDLTCHCQVLEGLVVELQDRVKRLEKKAGGS